MGGKIKGKKLKIGDLVEVVEGDDGRGFEGVEGQITGELFESGKRVLFVKLTVTEPFFEEDLLLRPFKPVGDKR